MRLLKDAKVREEFKLDLRNRFGVLQEINENEDSLKSRQEIVKQTHHVGNLRKSQAHKERISAVKD